MKQKDSLSDSNSPGDEKKNVGLKKLGDKIGPANKNPNSSQDLKDQEDHHSSQQSKKITHQSDEKRTMFK